MKLSIIIPTYNEEQYLPYLLETIEAQTWRDFEVIVADNNSTDRTREIAAKFGARVVSGGLPGAGRNRGAAVATGETVLFVDADIILPASDFLERSISEIESRQLGIATCYLLPMSEKLIDHLIHNAYNKYIKIVQGFSAHAPGICIFVAKAIFDKLNGFDEEVKLAEDHEFAQRAQKICQYGILTSYKIPVSVRRFDKDGRTKVTTKYVLAGMYMWTRGAVKSDILKYKFGYDDEK
jgi:glycosyltransferase involved in cell wall biosynthesis